MQANVPDRKGSSTLQYQLKTPLQLRVPVQTRSKRIGGQWRSLYTEEAMAGTASQPSKHQSHSPSRVDHLEELSGLAKERLEVLTLSVVLHCLCVLVLFVNEEPSAASLDCPGHSVHIGVWLLVRVGVGLDLGEPFSDLLLFAILGLDVDGQLQRSAETLGDLAQVVLWKRCG